MTKLQAYITLGCLLTLAACSSKSSSATDQASEPVTPVQVAAAKRGSIHHVLSAEAVLYPLKQANIVPKISAPVAKFYAQRGDHVREGQLLAVLEDRDLRAAATESKDLYEQAQATFTTTSQATVPEDVTKSKADVAASRQALDAARKVYESRQKLFQEGALARKLVDDAEVALAQAQSQFDTAQAHLKGLESYSRVEQIKSAQAQMDAAKAHYESAAAQLSYAEVRSPLTGVISDRGVNLGEMASAGSALFSIVDISRVVARANVPINETASIHIADAATISGPGGELPGKVTVVSPAADPNTTTVQVWVEAPNPGEHFRPGATARLNLDLGENKDAIIIPAAALLSSDQGGERVMIAGNDGLAHESQVETGIREGDQVEILSGVKPGDQVITQGALGLDDKAKIQVTKPVTQPGATEGGKE
ncbi:MAG: efflux RND transporter periplasmic adaptor subunit [Acidobacteriaceae bacterium]|nr:efflux RND transporter periplasmic adaptor subunit [Acidobacteriaceae bacterium]